MTYSDQILHRHEDQPQAPVSVFFMERLPFGHRFHERRAHRRHRTQQQAVSPLGGRARSEHQAVTRKSGCGREQEEEQ